jgi:hypothetical protein
LNIIDVSNFDYFLSLFDVQNENENWEFVFDELVNALDANPRHFIGFVRSLCKSQKLKKCWPLDCEDRSENQTLDRFIFQVSAENGWKMMYMYSALVRIFSFDGRIFTRNVDEPCCFVQLYIPDFGEVVFNLSGHEKVVYKIEESLGG